VSEIVVDDQWFLGCGTCARGVKVIEVKALFGPLSPRRARFDPWPALHEMKWRRLLLGGRRG
jgi:hypothetical protein